jgi:hypothetical protein
MNKELFIKLRNSSGYPAISMLLPTHRTSPENKQDPIRLKNLLTETRSRLAEEFTKRDLSRLEQQINKLDQIDHTYNKEGLAIFINEDLFEYERLLFAPEERVVIDETFATRDLIRAMHKAENYYVLVISRQKIRLFEGFLERVHEVKDFGFPMENNTLYETNSEMRSVSNREDDLIKEFFNRGDKAFQVVYQTNAAPLFVMGVDRNISHYFEIADKKKIIAGGITTGGDDATVHEVAQLAWPLARKMFEDRASEAISTLEKAVSNNRFESDLQLIWNAISEGRGDTLFVEKGYFQAAILEDGNITLSDTPSAPNVIDDIIDEVVELCLQYGGSVVFCEDGSLEKFQRMALVTRY